MSHAELFLSLSPQDDDVDYKDENDDDDDEMVGGTPPSPPRGGGMRAGSAFRCFLAFRGRLSNLPHRTNGSFAFNIMFRLILVFFRIIFPGRCCCFLPSA